CRAVCTTCMHMQIVQNIVFSLVFLGGAKVSYDPFCIECDKELTRTCFLIEFEGISNFIQTGTHKKKLRTLV
ncbi:hypothetical protein ACJX0J_008877, partial [Zea mays]